MKERMRYITVEEHELYEKLVDEYKIKGYSAPSSFMYCSNQELEKFPVPEIKKTKIKRSK